MTKPKTTKVKELRGSVKMVEREPYKPSGTVKRYILTAAQNATTVHGECWANLQHVAQYYEAKILVSRFKYQTSAKIAQPSGKPGKERLVIDEDYFDPRLDPYTHDSQIELAPGLVFCGEIQISPTAVNPLSGMDGYTGRASCIIPHTKQYLKCVPSSKHDGTKFIYSTGACTLRNYIEARAGQKASFHHVYGGLLVEVCPDGTWFVRQLQHASDGSMQDLNTEFLSDVTRSTSVAAIVWGDTHVAKADLDVLHMAYSDGGMLDALKPSYQFFHDVLDGRSINPHSIRKGLHHEMFRDWKTGQRSLLEELKATRAFLHELSWRDWCTSVVVNSNHDNFLQQWLRLGDYKQDHENALMFLKAEAHMYLSINEDPDKDPQLLAHMLRLQDSDIQFLREDESFVICKDSNGGIECGMHGHLGPNGSRGTLQQFAKMGRKCVVGHSHTAGIYEGAWQVGLSGNMDQGYNSGPSSWSHSHCVVYPNGKRAMVTMFNKRWRA